MKKFVLTAVVLMLCALGLYYAVYYEGWLYRKADGPVETVAVAEKDGIFLKVSEENAFEIRGVEMASVLPGHFDSDHSVEEETWLRWFDEIQEMGANTIRVDNIFSEEFYNAFYDFNKEAESPLYLLQGIQVSQYANYSKDDAYAENFFDRLMSDGKSAVDVIHGKKNIMLNAGTGSGTYRKDISDWVIGYVVGSNWESGVIAYTNENDAYPKSYVGNYFETTEEAGAFEAMLCKVMDSMVTYEVDKYAKKRLISFINAPENDPFAYDVFYGRQLAKYNCLDAEHIRPKDNFQGYFASYQVYEFCPGFTNYFAEEQKQKLQPVIAKLNRDYYYEGYTQLLAEYHSMPVVVANYSVSSSRGVDLVGRPYDEMEQGRLLLKIYEDIVASGCEGAFIATWQDNWNRVFWNTAYATELEGVTRWHDMQCVAQNCGILSFDTGEKESVCYVDGDINEWANCEPVVTNNKYTLYVQYDEAYVYFCVKGDKVRTEEMLYLPIDSSEAVGSSMCYTAKPDFERNADFLLCLNGPNNSKLMVHERYDSMRQNFLENVSGDNPFETYPTTNSRLFVISRTVLNKQMLATPDMEPSRRKAYSYASVYTTGELRMGNGNPMSKDYYSLSDFCYGDGCVEVRIPWNLLNFSNPSEMKIHKDYYEHFGVEHETIDTIYVGVDDDEATQPIAMHPVSLSGWEKKVTYHERLKQSYYVLKEGWNNRACN